ncbi:uncharacterized protein DUF2637 [Kribbella steppae]|uniref:Uncharacterized protein DUF2637 n=1 Tax=Kribbella steppae TaxID=2512223 RepID=A0A4R2HP69_9ACTN|nr:DUF2637 domain-containing protein [Kribbella steppae]TCO33021.1 uncharacterized protein DUF2637 [Kribbella steppae]
MNTFTNLLDALTRGESLTAPQSAVVLATGLMTVAAVAGLALMIHRATRAVARGNWTGRQVLIVLAILVAFTVAGIGGVQSFRAVSEKFDSALVPLVADGMVIACTALRLAALTRGWRIPGALLTTNVFIGGTVSLNIDAANGQADKAIAHALAPLAYAVLVEMLAHMLRLHLKLSQPARAKLSALTWFTSPVITTRVWLHLSRTGATDPVQARALVQQVVRMSSRLNTICPSRRGFPLDSARAARSAALQTIRDGLLTAGELAALLPTTGRMTAGELLAIVDSAALGLAVDDQQSRAEFPAWLVLYLLAAHRDQIDPTPVDSADDEPGENAEPELLPAWAVGYVFGALHQQSLTRTVDEQSTPTSAPLQARNGAHAPHHDSRTSAPTPVQPAPRSGAPAPVQHSTSPEQAGASVISAPVAESAQSGAGGRGKRSDESYVAELLELSRTKHGGKALTQRQITRETGVGFPKARRLAELAGWVEPADGVASGAPVVNDHDDTTGPDANGNDQTPEQHNTTPEEARELETSSNR